MKYKIIFSLVLSLSTLNAMARNAKATFAGGCFWCMEPPYEKLIGVKSVISGFSGGNKKNPSYEDVSGGRTTHREVVQVTYDDSLVSYERLLEVFWQNIDPTDNKGQFVDRGFQYSPGIFYHTKNQEKLAKDSLKKLVALKKFKKKIRTPIIEYKNFYAAEDYHQDYYKKNIISKTKYKYYRNASGRDQFLEKYWKSGELFITNRSKKYEIPSKEVLKKTLTELQYEVTQEEGTERPFKNEYWDNKKVGIYVDIVSGEPLFSSKDKFKSGTGWPSFTKPLVATNIVELVDNRLFSTRTEVRSRHANSHLGHVFKDGPKPLGLRYCLNSAAMKFIPKDKMKELGYEEYLSKL
jgi:peptide methionine sulfoxide reductase msrA/msrB